MVEEAANQYVNTQLARSVKLYAGVNGEQSYIMVGRYQLSDFIANMISDWVNSEAAFNDVFLPTFLAQNVGVDAERVYNMTYRLTFLFQLPTVSRNNAVGQGFHNINETFRSPYGPLALIEHMLIYIFETSPEIKENHLSLLDYRQIPENILVCIILKLLMDCIFAEIDLFNEESEETDPLKVHVDFIINREQTRSGLFHKDSSEGEGRAEYQDILEYLTLTFLSPFDKRQEITIGTHVIPDYKPIAKDNDVLTLGMLHGGTLILRDEMLVHATPRNVLLQNPVVLHGQESRQPETPLKMANQTAADVNLRLIRRPGRMLQNADLLRVIDQRLQRGRRTLLRCHYIHLSKSVVYNHPVVLAQRDRYFHITPWRSFDDILKLEKYEFIKVSLINWIRDVILTDGKNGDFVGTFNDGEEFDQAFARIMDETDLGLGKRRLKSKSRLRQGSKQKSKQKKNQKNKQKSKNKSQKTKVKK